MKKALLVGINAYPSAPLNGCINDVDDMAYFLHNKRNVMPEEIVILKDIQATTENILHELNSLVLNMIPGYKYLFHYSGHGTQMQCVTGEEKDGKDECICPVDFDWSEKHVIRDNQFFEIFSKIPDGAILYWISDSCHSGDLEKSMDMRTRLYPLQGAKSIPVRNRKNWFKKLFNCDNNISYLKNVVMLSGCRDSQTSADAYFNGRYNGALTYYLLKSLKDKSCFIDVYYQLCRLLKKDSFSQKPQIVGNETLVMKEFMK